MNPNKIDAASAVSGGGSAPPPSNGTEAEEYDAIVAEAEDEGGQLSDQPKGTAPASDPSSIDRVNGAVSSNITTTSSGAVAANEGEMVSNYSRTEDGGATENTHSANEVSAGTATQPGVVFVPGPGFDNDDGIRTGYNTPTRGLLGTVNNEDAAVNSDIENQTTLIEAYTVPDDDEQAERIDYLEERLGSTRNELEVARSQLTAPVVEGVPISDDEQGTKKKGLTIGACVLFLGAIAVGVGLAVFFTNNTGGNNAGGNDDDEPPEDAVQVFPPVLEALKERRVLRCGIYDRYGFSSINDGTNEREGFEIDLCKAIAAAALGSSYRYELVQTTGANRFVKLANGEFDVLISGTTYTFDRDVHESSSGIGFSFSTPYLYGGMTFNGVPEFVECADNLSVIGECANIRICSILGTTWYDLTKTLFPTSNIVLTGDQTESFQNLIEGKCNVIQGEQYEAPVKVVRDYGYEGPYAQGVTSFTKDPLAIVTRDGDPEFADFAEWVLQSLMLAEVENITMVTADTFAPTGEVFGDQYKDMFQNALAAVGNYGEIYDRHLESISPRLKVNTINHGESGLLYAHPFGRVDTVGPGPVKGGTLESIRQRGVLRCGIPVGNETSVGLDMEFCRAIAASILGRSPDKISFKSVSASYENISLALGNGDIDVYAGGVVDMKSNVVRPGLSFSKPYFYEAPGGNSTAWKAIALVTQEADAQWTDLVNWVAMSTYNAEENGITQRTSNEMPLVNLFGVGLERLFRNAILAVGNYDEMYRRVFGQIASREGRNMLNSSPFQPQHYPVLFGKYLAEES